MWPVHLYSVGQLITIKFRPSKIDCLHDSFQGHQNMIWAGGHSLFNI